MRVIVTGFGQFGGVDENPTELIVRNLMEKSMNVDDFEILKVAVNEVSTFHDKFDSNEDCVFIHLGVHSSTDCMLLEKCAYNNMTFRIPDQCGYAPDCQCISDGDCFDSAIESDIDIQTVVDHLVGEGFLVKASEDPGRYLCNYVYYRSLAYQIACGKKKRAIFIHVPPIVNMELEKQVVFVERCIEIICQHVGSL